MKRVVLVLVLAGCGPKDVRVYDNSLFQLASGFSAKEVCSCLYVQRRDEADCAEWTRVSPNVARFKVDDATKTVTAKALGMGRQVARWQDEQTGCVVVRE